MRLVNYATPWGARAGILVDELVVDTVWLAGAAGLRTEGDGRFASNRRVIQLDDSTLAELGGRSREVAAAGPGAPGVLALDGLTLEPPLGDPSKIICVAFNYRAHINESGMDVPESPPPLFPKFTTALGGPCSRIVIPPATAAVDYEGELAVVIGRTCKGVSAAEAIDFVAGAMVFNDVSARDMKIATGQLLNAKALDTFAPCGPSLVLMDEIDDLQDLQVTTRLNGEIVQDASTALMVYSVAQLIEYTTTLLTLHPGDIIATGTPAGVGAAADPPRFLGVGDMVEVTVGELGTIRNEVVAGMPTIPPAAAWEAVASELLAP